MTLVWVNPSGGALLIEEATKGFVKRKISGVDGFLCTNCGQVDLLHLNQKFLGINIAFNNLFLLIMFNNSIDI